MYLKVDHTTAYTYSEVQNMVVQSHRLYPSNCESQTVVEWQVDVDHARFGDYFIDGAGDRLRTMTINKKVDLVEVRVTGTVHTEDANGFAKIKQDRIPALVYCASSQLTEADDALMSLARESINGDQKSELDQAHAMMNAISEAVVYTSGSTTAQHTAAEALAQGKGVCQDQTHCLLAIARTNGIPARYVTGYLYDAEKGDNYGESHAWAELYTQDLGWIGFDAANRCCPDHRYIRIGSGFDSLDAALIRGISRGSGFESMQTSVHVSQSQQ